MERLIRCEVDLLCYYCRRRWMGSRVFLWRAATNMAIPCCTLLAGAQTLHLILYLCICMFLLPPLPSLAHHVTPCSNGHMRIVKLLLRAGAAVNSENAKGQVNSGLGSNGSCFRVPRGIIAPQMPSVVLVCATTRVPADTCRLGLPAQLQ